MKTICLIFLICSTFVLADPITQNASEENARTLINNYYAALDASDPSIIYVELLSSSDKKAKSLNDFIAMSKDSDTVVMSELLKPQTVEIIKAKKTRTICTINFEEKFIAVKEEQLDLSSISSEEVYTSIILQMLSAIGLKGQDSKPFEFFDSKILKIANMKYPPMQNHQITYNYIIEDGQPKLYFNLAEESLEVAPVAPESASEEVTPAIVSDSEVISSAPNYNEMELVSFKLKTNYGESSFDFDNSVALDLQTKNISPFKVVAWKASCVIKDKLDAILYDGFLRNNNADIGPGTEDDANYEFKFFDSAFDHLNGLTEKNVSISINFIQVVTEDIEVPVESPVEQ